MSYRLSQKPSKTSINVNTSYVGETLEQKIVRVVNNKEPISDGAELIYTERKDGVLPDHDIRTDKIEYALDAMTTVAKTHRAKRENKPKLGEEAKKNMETEKKTETKTE